MRIRRIAIRIRSLRAFRRRRTLCRTVLFYAFRKLGGVGVVLVKLFASVVKLLQRIIDFLLRSIRLLEQVFGFVECFAVGICCRFSSSVLGIIRSRAIRLLEAWLRRVLKRRAWMSGCVLVNRLNQLVGLSRKLIQRLRCFVHFLKDCVNIPVQRLTVFVRLNVFQVVLIVRVAIFLWDNVIRNIMTICLILRKRVSKRSC